MMPPRKLDRRIQYLSWGFLAALFLLAATMALAAAGSAPAWAVAAFVTLVVFAIIGALAALNLAQAWADGQRGPDEDGRQPPAGRAWLDSTPWDDAQDTTAPEGTT